MRENLHFFNGLLRGMIHELDMCLTFSGNLISHYFKAVIYCLNNYTPKKFVVQSFEFCGLQDNVFSGRILDTICDLNSLKNLSLNENQLIRLIPEGLEI
ncbi:hypothetical protein H5410_028357 [Solanum commersonii]|uniref:Uncharacterized protein n=1 Tax=Solanum commersonii TaxID=4109 RepID=A0A9J5Z1V3_SOLCO|nr:hypothetical protein H5410_028357 [Solanum commersonii]